MWSLLHADLPLCCHIIHGFVLILQCKGELSLQDIEFAVLILIGHQEWFDNKKNVKVSGGTFSEFDCIH